MKETEKTTAFTPCLFIYNSTQEEPHTRMHKKTFFTIREWFDTFFYHTRMVHFMDQFRSLEEVNISFFLWDDQNCRCFMEENKWLHSFTKTLVCFGVLRFMLVDEE